jgi:hypothetical protein
VIVQWQTSSEINVSHFELQRSSNNLNYTSIANINATNNNTQNNYHFTDLNALNNPVQKLYYRLRMVDIDGQYKYSGVAVINNHTSSILTIYPNPAKDYILMNGVKEGLAIEINDASGKLVKRFIANTSNRYVVSDLHKGLYFIKIQDKENTTVTKLIIE